jgi:hypothetical protein
MPLLRNLFLLSLLLLLALSSASAQEESLDYSMDVESLDYSMDVKSSDYLMGTDYPTNADPLSYSTSAEPLERLLFLIERLRTRNKERSEQHAILLEQSNSSEEQLRALREDFDLSERELSLLKSVSESQGEYINSLSTLLRETEKISTRQSSLLKGSLLANRIMGVALVVAVPAAFVAGILIAR